MKRLLLTKSFIESLIFQMAILQFMSYSRGKIAGMLFFIAATQFVLCLTISEALYPGYSVSDNYVSDLGVGPSAVIFNSSVFILGLLLLVGTYFLRHVSGFKTLNTLLILMAIGAMGVGVFTKDFHPCTRCGVFDGFFLRWIVSHSIIQSAGKAPYL